MDHGLVKRLRGDVGDRLAEQRRLDAAAGMPPMTGEDERQFARALISQVLEEHARSEILVGRPPLNAQEEEDLAEAIHAALFGVGRLQPLLEDQNIENIDINGCDRVFIGYADGSEVLGEPVAESDEELTELIQVLAAYSGLSSRPFDTANPQLDLRLPDGSRLSAVMDVTLRPAISIRRARMGKVFLADLVGNGTISPDVGTFLAAAVAARKNIMIAGATNAGKTTLLRALANQIPAEERLITVERALELGLDHFPELHPNVVAFEERLPNSEGQGAITMADLVRRSLRMNPSRVIVGEVLGDEIVTMLNAMTQGNDGSLSTIHSNSSLEVFNRISTYAIQSAERLPVDATHMLIAGAIDFVVFTEKRNEYTQGGRLRRFVSSVREVTGVDGRVLSSEVFAPGRDGRAVPHAPASCLDELAAFGYDPGTGRLAVNSSALPLLAIGAGALAGAGLFVLIAAIRGLPPKAKSAGPSALERAIKDMFSIRGAIAVIVGILTLLITRWVVAGIGMALLAYSWRSLSGAASERKAMARLEGLATWTESLRDTIAGAVGLEQAIPASTRVADASIREPLTRLVDRLHTRVPMHVALRRFAEDLDDSSADMIIAALIINSRLRGPGLRDLLGALADSVREELDMRRKINSSRRSTRRSVQIVIAVSVLMAIFLAVLDHRFLEPYDSVFGQLVLAVIVGIYALGIIWLRKLARFDMPQRLLGTATPAGQAQAPAAEPETVAAWRAGNGPGNAHGAA